ARGRPGASSDERGEARRVAEFLGEMIETPLPDEPSGLLRAARNNARIMAEQVRRAFVDLVAAECAVHPLVLVLEDLHWGDPSSVKLVGAALESVHNAPFFVLALARPEVHDLFPGLWSERDMQHLRLRELSPSAALTLVQSVAGEAWGGSSFEAL